MIKFLRSPAKHDQNGFTTAWMLGLVLLIFMVGGAFFDMGTALVQRQKLVTAADRAANAGATAIDEQELIESDGATIQLNSDSANGQTAVARCEAVLDEEETGQASSILERGASGCQVLTANPFNSQVIEVSVEGNVRFGFIGFLGVPSKTFTVVSRARPSCSDVTSSTGNC